MRSVIPSLLITQMRSKSSYSTGNDGVRKGIDCLGTSSFNTLQNTASEVLSAISLLKSVLSTPTCYFSSYLWSCQESIRRNTPSGYFCNAMNRKGLFLNKKWRRIKTCLFVHCNCMPSTAVPPNVFQCQTPH